jgi:hypothetical protein
LEKLDIFLTFVNLYPGLAMDIEEDLLKDPAKYAYRRIELRAQYHGPSGQAFDDVVHTDHVPHDMTIMNVPTSDIYNGTITDNPFEVVHGKMVDLRVNAAGLQVPFAPWNLDWDQGLTARAYEHFITHNGDIDTGISREMWENGNSFFPFMLTATMTDEDNFEPMKDGPTLVSQRHAGTVGTSLPTAHLTKGYTSIYISAFQALLVMDFTRTVRSDLTA